MASIDKTNEIDALSRLAGKVPVTSSDAQNEIDVDNEDLKEINDLLSKVDSGEIIDPGLSQVAQKYKAAEVASASIPQYTVGDESPDFFDDDEEEQDLDKAIAQAEEAMHRLEDPEADNNEIIADEPETASNETIADEPETASNETIADESVAGSNETIVAESETASNESTALESETVSNDSIADESITDSISDQDDTSESETPKLEEGANVADNNVPEVPTASDDPNKQLSPEEIAAMFAAAGGGDSAPEPEPAPAAPDLGDDPNKQLSPEEIAAMFAAAGGGDSAPEPEPEPAAPEPEPAAPEPAAPDLGDDPNKKLSPEEIAAMFAAAGGGDSEQAEAEPSEAETEAETSNEAEPEAPSDEPSPEDILKSMQPADDDPNRSLSPEEIEAMFAAAGGADAADDEGQESQDSDSNEDSEEEQGSDELSLEDIQEESPELEINEESAEETSEESASDESSSEDSNPEESQEDELSLEDTSEEPSSDDAGNEESSDESSQGDADEASEDLDSLMDSLGSDDMDLLENGGSEGAPDELSIEEPSDELNIEEPSGGGDELSLEEGVEGGEDLNLDGGDDLMSLSEGGASEEEAEDEEASVSNDELDDIELEKKSSKGKKGGKKPAKEKKAKEDDGEKKGFFAKILAALFKEDDEEGVSGDVENNELASLTDENQAVLNEIEGDKKDKKKKKEKEPKPKKEKKPAKKKEKKPKQPKEPKPKKEKKPKVPDGPPPKPIPPRKFILAFLLVIPIGILCALPAYTVPEKAIHEEAQMAFLNGDYESAYRDYYSLYRAGKLSEDDQILYWKARYISQMRHFYNQYEVFASMGLDVEALNALVKGVEQYEEIMEDNERLRELELEYKPGSTPDSLVETEVNIAYYNIQSALETEYGLSIDDVKELIIIEEEVDYTKQLQIICGLRAAPE